MGGLKSLSHNQTKQPDQTNRPAEPTNNMEFEQEKKKKKRIQKANHCQPRWVQISKGVRQQQQTICTKQKQERIWGGGRGMQKAVQTKPGQDRQRRPAHSPTNVQPRSYEEQWRVNSWVRQVCGVSIAIDCRLLKDRWRLRACVDLNWSSSSGTRSKASAASLPATTSSAACCSAWSSNSLSCDETELAARGLACGDGELPVSRRSWLPRPCFWLFLFHKRTMVLLFTEGGRYACEDAHGHVFCECSSV